MYVRLHECMFVYVGRYVYLFVSMYIYVCVYGLYVFLCMNFV